MTQPGHIVITTRSGRSTFCLYACITTTISAYTPTPNALILTSIFSAVLLIAYDVTFRHWSCILSESTLPMLPPVLVMCRIFFARPRSRNGSTTCEMRAGAAVFVRMVVRSASGSMVNAVSQTAWIAGARKEGQSVNSWANEAGGNIPWRRC